MQITSNFERCRLSETKFTGWLDNYVTGVSDQWLKIAPSANPAMLEMFRDRDRTPRRELLPWSGEFAGKYLTSAVQVYRLVRDAGLRDYLQQFVKELISCQDTDGYLGPWPIEKRLAGEWDGWGHYHIMVGLIFWYEETGDEKALACAQSIADLLCNKFLNAEPGKRLVDIGATEMNLAPVHSLCMLYEKTGIEKYLSLAKQISEEFQCKGTDGVQAGDYIQTALKGMDFFEIPKPRWESLHPIMGIAALYRITGDDDYRKAFEHIWWSIVKTDRHNNGGFSAGEQAQGTPYHTGAIETCCTIAWLAASVEMLKLSGNSIVADEIELSTINSVIGMHSFTGRWVTYNTPMDGVRRASAHDIVFQAKEGSPELNCCSVNGPRGFGMISDWALMTNGQDIVVNYYGPSTLSTNLPSGNKITLHQETEYPVANNITLCVNPKESEDFAILLRIPYWSKDTKVKVNGNPINTLTPGEYLRLERQWAAGDRIEIELDFSLHYWVHEDQVGMASIYRGPVLLTYDRRFNKMDPENIPTLDANNMTGVLLETDKYWIQPVILMEFDTSNGEKLRLCDFGSAGEGGTPYKSWLSVANLPISGQFSRSNPLRSVHI